MSEQEVPVSVTPRIIIKLLTQEDVKQAEIRRRSTNRLKKQIHLGARAFPRHKHFIEGREDVETESCARKARTSITDNNIGHIQQLFDDDKRLKIIE